MAYTPLVFSMNTDYIEFDPSLIYENGYYYEIEKEITSHVNEFNDYNLEYEETDFQKDESIHLAVAVVPAYVATAALIANTYRQAKRVTEAIKKLCKTYKYRKANDFAGRRGNYLDEDWKKNAVKVAEDLCYRF